MSTVTVQKQSAATKGSTMEDIEQRSSAVALAMSEMGIRVVHGVGRADTKHAKGGVTLAFKPTPDETRLELAVAVCHPKEEYSRRSGRVMAVEALIRGESVLIPRIRGVDDRVLVKGVADSLTSPIYAC